MGKHDLFDEDEGTLPKTEQLKVNKDFAARFEHNKKREELHRLREKYPEVAARLEARAALQQEEAEESTSEDEDDGYIPDKTEAQILETILKIRKKDKSIYDKDAKFYSSSDEDDDGDGDQEHGGEHRTKKKEKPVYLKDMVYKEAMDRAAGLAIDSDEDGDQETKVVANNKKVKTYTEEQQELKNAFLSAFEQDVDEVEEEIGGVLKVKKGKRKYDANNEEEGGEEKGNRVQELLDAYFASGKSKKDSDTNASDADDFLRSYILNKGWVDDKADGNAEDDEEGEVDEEEDEAAWMASEHFEAKYNFRYEEPGGAELITHPRLIEGTIRKEDDRRKRQRQEKAARKLAEEEERRAELKRLKNLKKAEIQEKLAELQTVAGAAAPDAEVLDTLLAGDFDPEAYDKAMADAFGDNYYEHGDEEEEEDVEHDEAFERELTAMAEYDTDDDGNGKGNNKNTFASIQKKLQDINSTVDPNDRENILKLLEEYHKLDYEDVIGGIPTRFRYKEVEPESYGLSIEEILAMDDKELNQIVGFKKVAAPYRTDAKKVRPNYGKLNELRREKYGGVDKSHTRHKHHPHKDVEHTQHHRKQYYVKEGSEKTRGEEKERKQTEAELRLTSFAAPKLKKRKDRQEHGGGDDVEKKKDKKKKKKKNNDSNNRSEGERSKAQPQTTVPSGLKKSQKKNLKRSAKRAAKRESGEQAKSVEKS